MSKIYLIIIFVGAICTLLWMVKASKDLRVTEDRQKRSKYVYQIEIESQSGSIVTFQGYSGYQYNNIKDFIEKYSKIRINEKYLTYSLNNKMVLLPTHTITSIQITQKGLPRDKED